MRIILLVFLFISFAKQVFALECKGAPEWCALYTQQKEDYSESIEGLVQRKDTITGIELILATSGKGFISRFGHILLRFIDQDSNALNDTVIQFVADVNEPKLSLVGGAFSKYKMTITAESFSSVIDRYVVSESRNLIRYPIKVSANQLSEIFNVLKNGPDTQKKYSFFKNNCSRGLLGFLQQTQRSSGRTPIRPNKAGSWLKKSGLITDKENVSTIIGRKERITAINTYIEKKSGITKITLDTLTQNFKSLNESDQAFLAIHLKESFPEFFEQVSVRYNSYVDLYVAAYEIRLME